MAQASGAQDTKSGISANAPNPINLNRIQMAPKDEDRYPPEYPLIARQPLRVKDKNRRGKVLYAQPKRDNYSSVPLCEHLELFLD